MESHVAARCFKATDALAVWSYYCSIAHLLSVSFALCQQPAASGMPAPQPRPAQPPDKPFELQALTPEFWKLFDKDAKLKTMGTGFGFTEGPVWDPAGFVWVSDE